MSSRSRLNNLRLRAAPPGIYITLDPMLMKECPDAVLDVHLQGGSHGVSLNGPADKMVKVYGD